MQNIYDNSGIAGIEYIENGMINSKASGRHYYFQKTMQGDIVKIVDESGKCVVEYCYDAWGKAKIKFDTSGVGIGEINPFRYRGYYYDTDTGLYYLTSRYYDPETCRFISPDDVEVVTSLGSSRLNGLNLYSYCFNDPIKYVDKAGMWPESNSDAIDFLSMLLEAGIGLGLTAVAWAAKTGVRPNNIGIGIFAKNQAKQIANLTKGTKVLSKVSTGMAILATAFQVYEGIQTDIDRGYSTGRIVSNAVTNTAVYAGITFGTSWAMGLIGTKIGTALGSVVPGLGNVIGAIVGFAIGIGVGLLLEWQVNGKSIIDHVRDAVYNFWDWLF